MQREQLTSHHKQIQAKNKELNTLKYLQDVQIKQTREFIHNLSENQDTEFEMEQLRREIVVKDNKIKEFEQLAMMHNVPFKSERNQYT